MLAFSLLVGTCLPPRGVPDRRSPSFGVCDESTIAFEDGAYDRRWRRSVGHSGGVRDPRNRVPSLASSKNSQIPTCALRAYPIGHHERLAVGAGQEPVRFGVVDERLGRRVDVELAAEPVIQAVERDAVVLEVFFHAGEGLVGFLVVAEGLGRLVERDLVAQPVRDIGQVAERGRVVAFEDVGVEVLDLAAADGGDEVGEVPVARPALSVDLDEVGERLGLVLPLG